MHQPRFSDDTADLHHASSVVAVNQQSSSAVRLEPAVHQSSPVQSPPRYRKAPLSTAAPVRLPRTSSLLPPPPAAVAAAAAATTVAIAFSPPYSSSEAPPFPGRAFPRLESLPDTPPDEPSYDTDRVADTSAPKLQLPLLSLPPLSPLGSLSSLDEDIESRLEGSGDRSGSGGGDGASSFDTARPIPSDMSDATTAAATRPVPAMLPYEKTREPHASVRGHSRSRSGKNSVDLAKHRTAKGPSQKAMLSRALQKANTAVQLDNAQNFEGARQSYSEACELLRHVLLKTSADEDKKKLEAIRRTYATRIEELDQMAPAKSTNNKELPARPESSEEPDAGSPQAEIVEVETVDKTYGGGDDDEAPSQQAKQRQDTRYLNGGQDVSRPARAATEQPSLHSAFSRSPQKLRSVEDYMSDGNRAPPMSSVRRSASPQKPQLLRNDSDDRGNESYHSGSWSGSRDGTGHLRSASQNSWLDPIDESGGSTSTSIHSRTSSTFRSKHFRGPSGNTEAEFDTALDAAIEAAYDEGYEPVESQEHDTLDRTEDIVNKALRKVEEARERVRQTEREAYPDKIKRRAAERRTQQESGAFYDDNLSSDEEERILEEMAREYNFNSFFTSDKSKAGISQPPESYRQGARPEANLMGTSPAPGVKPTTATLDRSVITQQRSVSKGLQPSAPPPNQSLPDLPPARGPTPEQTVRNRRMSGQNPKQLKIQTNQVHELPIVILHDESSTKAPLGSTQSSEATAAERPQTSRSARRPSSPTIDAPASEAVLLGSPPYRRGQVDVDELQAARSGSPTISRLRKNISSSSLRSLKTRNMSISNLDDASDMSPGTPNNPFGNLKAPAMPALPTPLATSLRDQMELISPGNIGLFEDSIHLPATPGLPNPLVLDPPVALEACPSDVMLRPFWLMRCLFQTLVHPRGGYLSTKLFVPREVWKVKGVKLKNMEDKVSNCDLLTAALQKLAKVDTCDADAVLDELQSLEGVLEQVQNALSRKLGNEVGVQSSGMLFKEASNVVEGDGASNVPRTTSVSAKPSSFSWRRLRSKNSSIGLGGAYGAYNSRTAGGDSTRDSGTMPTLPMTPQPTSRPPKRDITQAQFLGPNAQYMNSLARLFDAAQAIDQIARQVDDPGLRHADKTQVGLELCTRHAAEFFAFYICRFVLTDLSLLLDKFIKRGSEWVLS